jgi:hypothetical protein
MKRTGKCSFTGWLGVAEEAHPTLIEPHLLSFSGNMWVEFTMEPSHSGPNVHVLRRRRRRDVA